MIPSSPYVNDSYRVTSIRIIKKNSVLAGLPSVTVDADFPCEILKDEPHFFETEREYVVSFRHLLLQDGCMVDLRMHLPSDVLVDKVVLEHQSIPFIQKENELRFTLEISGLMGRCRSLDAHTLVRENGLTVRIEQNDPQRRTGPYRTERYPETEVKATRCYMFAARRISYLLGLPEYLHSNHLGYIFILGFETCNAIHGDYPPHWHFIYRWPGHAGSQAPHIYVDETGKMVQDRVSIDLLHEFGREIPNGTWFKCVDPYGRDVVALCLDDDGFLSFATPQSAVYAIGPWKEGRGCSILAGGKVLGFMQVEDLLNQSIFRATYTPENPDVHTEIDEIRYDRVTGQLTSVEHKA